MNKRLTLRKARLKMVSVTYGLNIHIFLQLYANVSVQIKCNDNIPNRASEQISNWCINPQRSKTIFTKNIGEVVCDKY